MPKAIKTCLIRELVSQRQYGVISLKEILYGKVRYLSPVGQ
ncbi:hypothetical protein HMPREF9303_0677 [Prevotella denticola CRIS 18C-A]|uniref:Uncharacterized protein n=1 Tax=Prevotella denticola CRIS 18C-A TaxID=944557 RepID=F0H8K2_9BACT|nr:hypothetical protein HMPREF9303_0677 [Prevotella denticola CRIS 18C-A]